MNVLIKLDCNNKSQILDTTQVLDKFADMHALDGRNKILALLLLHQLSRSENSATDHLFRKHGV